MQFAIYIKVTLTNNSVKTDVKFPIKHYNHKKMRFFFTITTKSSIVWHVNNIFAMNPNGIHLTSQTHRSHSWLNQITNKQNCNMLVKCSRSLGHHFIIIIECFITLLIVKRCIRSSRGVIVHSLSARRYCVCIYITRRCYIYVLGVNFRPPHALY